MKRPVALLLAFGLVLSILITPTPSGTATAQSLVNALDLELLHAKLADVDTRVGVIQPTQQQLSDIAALGANVTWNRFGTPQSLIKYGGVLAAGLNGDAVSVAREWVRANRGLFRLSDQSVTDLEMVNDITLTGTSAHVVLFNQRFGNLSSVQDGMITVAVNGDKVVYVSSSAAGDAPNPGGATLSPKQAWINAALDIGRSVSLPNVTNTRAEHSWTLFDVAGFSEPQRARLRALPIPGAGVRPVFEVNVTNSKGAELTGYTSFVDAQSGQVLFRQNRVQHASHENAPTSVPTTAAFSGVYAATAPKCGPRHPIDVPSGTTRIVVVATATIPANDITLSLVRERDNVIVATQDTGTSPEELAYTPAGGVTAGQYSVLVCEAGNASATVPPTSYSGTITVDDTVLPDSQQSPKWKFFTANPPLDYSSTDTRTLGCWEKAPGGVTDPACQLELRNLAARATWDYSAKRNGPTNTTIGNAANSSESWLGPLTPAEQYRPVSAQRNYSYPWTNQWYNEKCSPTVFASTQRNDIDAAVTSLFANHNRMHDWSYFLGFTEQAYNAQDSNFGNTPVERENDPEIGNAQAGAVDGGAPQYLGRDNANQLTLQDGIPPVTNMYLWQPIAAAFYPACVDGDFDMSIIGHEYTHLISNRMVGGPESNLTGNQAGAMGESWSDLSAVEYLNEYGFVPTNGENPFAVGAYVTGNKQTGIRNYSMDKNPLVYGNFGYDLACNSDLATGACTDDSEFHSDAEIWDGVNFDIRQALITKYNGSFPASNRALQLECADGKRQAAQCPGNRRWIQLVFDAFLLMQPAVTFLDARDAYLAADVLRFGGANQKELWNAFAKRGMGQFASTTGSEDVDPIANYESPLAAEATITFNPVASNEGNMPVSNARIYVGRFEARGTPIADTDPATSLGNAAKFVPGSYEFVAQAPGYGLYRFTANISSNQTLTIRMPTNLASTSKGATARGDGVNLDKLIDDTENSTWARLNAPQDVRGTEVTVDLSGGARKVTFVQVSAMQRLRGSANQGADTGSQSRFSALRGFEVWTCNADIAANQNCANASNFTKIYTSAEDAFPGRVPRPAAPDLIMRKFDVPDTLATHVKLVVLTNQCTGSAAFQGETDNDPANTTDCNSSAASKNVRAAELQVFSS